MRTDSQGRSKQQFIAEHKQRYKARNGRDPQGDYDWDGLDWIYEPSREESAIGRARLVEDMRRQVGYPKYTPAEFNSKVQEILNG